MTTKLEHFIVRKDCEYATFVVLQRSGYYMLAIESSFGSGYAYAWREPGVSFYDFLIRMESNPGYVTSKMCQGEVESPDWEKTYDHVRSEICRARKRGWLDADEARRYWPADGFDSELGFHQWLDENAADEYFSEWWTLIQTAPTQRVTEFAALHKLLWPGFAEQLKAAKERDERASEHLGVLGQAVADETSGLLKASSIELG